MKRFELLLPDGMHNHIENLVEQGIFASKSAAVRQAIFLVWNFCPSCGEKLKDKYGQCKCGWSPIQR